MDENVGSSEASKPPNEQTVEKPSTSKEVLNADGKEKDEKEKEKESDANENEEEEEAGEVQDDSESVLSLIWTQLIRDTLVPAAVILVAPIVAITLPYIIIHYNSDLDRALYNGNWRTTLTEVMWKSASVGLRIDDWEIWAILGTLLLWGLMSTFCIGGEYYYGPLVVDGFRPEYRKAAIRFYVLTMLASIPFFVYFPALHMYYKISSIAASLTLIGLVLSGVMYFKAIWYPSPGQASRTGNVIADFYYGIEMSPSLLDPIIDLKIAFVSRFGVLLWQVLILVACKANYELYHFSAKKGEFNLSIMASTIIQSVYIFKFYMNEEVYTHSLEMTNSRLGYYLIFGGLTFVPALYPLTSLHLVRHSPHPEEFGPLSFVIAVTFGIALTIWSYFIDRQRYHARVRTSKPGLKGKNDLEMWPNPDRAALLIRARYTTPKGVVLSSVLLAGGWWGCARHLNYTIDWLIGLTWCLCAASFDSILPHLYWIVLGIFFIIRERRDNAKCAAKYGEYWDEYCKLVPYRLIPYIY